MGGVALWVWLWVVFLNVLLGPVLGFVQSTPVGRVALALLALLGAGLGLVLQRPGWLLVRQPLDAPHQRRRAKTDPAQRVGPPTAVGPRSE